MKTVRLQRPEMRWLLAGGVLSLAVLAWASWTVVVKYRQAADRLDEIGPRYARLAGLLQNSERVREAEGTMKANLAEFVYPSEEDASQIGNAALQRVRDLATARGLRVASSQTAAPREEKGFDRIGLNLRVEGDWSQLVALLRELPRQRPLIHCATLQIGAERGGRPDASSTVFGQFDLYVLKERRP